MRIRNFVVTTVLVFAISCIGLANSVTTGNATTPVMLITLFNYIGSAAAAGPAGSTQGKVVLVQTATTASLGGSVLTAGTCAAGTTGIGQPATGHPASVAASDGTYQSNFLEAASINGQTVTVWVCAISAGTPTAKTYNVTVF